MRILWWPILVVSVVLAAGGSPAGAAEPTPSEQLVTAAYEGLLGRAPETAGLVYWSGLIDGGARTGDVVKYIGDSPERRGFVVTQTYERILDRRPDLPGLAYWSEGFIDRLTAAELTLQIFASEEFFLRNGATNRGFVTGLYAKILNRTPDAEGLDYWVDRLDRGAGRRAVARQFVLSVEGILQPELSVESSIPSAGGPGSADRIRIDLDRSVDPDATAVVVSIAGRRIPGTVSGDPVDDTVIVFETDTRTTAQAGAHVVVTVFALTPGPVVESVDFSYRYAPGPSGIDPTGELIIAFYGHPRAPVLGVAGEGTPDQARQRLLAQAAPYSSTGRPIVPAFEMIATLVTASPGEDRLYRNRATDQELRAYLDAIRSVNGRLILDIQPGRADVETEARAYEQLLVEPEVGLALDPEWVVGPTQTPRGRIGTLDASAINRVATYLSELVATHDLPPKILIIHRFKAEMVTNTHLIQSPEGVRILFQADGEGGPAAKLADYDTLLPERFERGIKIFYDEDSPTMTPDQLLARTNPDPTYISYQ